MNRKVSLKQTSIQVGFTVTLGPDGTVVARSRSRRPAWLRRSFSLFFGSTLLCGLPFVALAQHYIGPSAQSGFRNVPGPSLPESSLPQSNRQPGTAGARAAEGSASISGVALDVSGAVVVGAQVVLADKDGSQRSTLLSGSDGEFTFGQLSPGVYLVLINAPGLEPFKSAEITVTAQQSFELPKILLAVATGRSEVTVHTTEAIAAEQIKVEEKQRVLGILPNFYTSFLPDAAPLTTKQKYSLMFRGTFDPVRFIGSAVSAAVQQANNSYAGYGQGGAGYGKRFAADYGNGLSSDILTHALFPSIFHQDPRYFYQGTGTFKSRFIHAISFSVIARSDTGHPMPNYSFLLGDIGSGALSNLYYPHASRGTGLIFTNAAIGIGGRAGGSLIREFILKRITTHVPDNQKP